jgi:transposase InsO family protein
MTDPTTFNKGFDKLNATNWASWKLNVQLALTNAKVWKYVKLTPPAQSDAAISDESKSNTLSGRTTVELPEGNEEESSLALSIIRFSMNSDQLQYIGNEMNPRKAWKMLVTAKEAKTGMALVTKLTELMNIKQSEDTPVTEHCARISQIKSELEELIDTDHKKFSKALYAALLVRSLNDRYESFTVNVLQAEAEQLEFDDIVRRAKLEEQRQKDRSISLPNNEPNVASANYARTTSIQRGKKYCSFHKSSSHNDSECYSQHPELKRNRKEQSAKKEQSADSAEIQFANMIYSSTATPSNQWLIDSAATIHMCNDRTLFSNMRQIPANTIVFGSGDSMQSTEAGDIMAKVRLDNGEFVVKLRNVLYAPTIKRNLISMMHWTKYGVTCRTESDGSCVIRQYGIDMGRIQAKNNLLPVTLIPIHKLNSIHSQSENSATHSSIDQATLWHRRLGHVNGSDMKRLLNMAEGFDCTTEFNDDCESCAKGKLHAVPHPKHAQHRAQTKLMLIHTDLCSMPESREGFRYFISFIDDCTRLAQVHLLRNKHEAMKAFMDYKARMELATQRNIIMLRSDGGGEYMSKQFAQLLSDEGIQHQISAPYSQQQNGVSERFNRTVVECARTMLNQAGLDKTYWSHAVLTATHIRNRLPTVALDGMTPFEAFYGYKPSLHHLRVFGCRAYALIPKSQRNKMDVKAHLCINLGYAPGYKAYHLLDTTTNRVIVSRNVRFAESRFLNDNDGQVGAVHRQLDVDNEDANNITLPNLSLANRTFTESDNAIDVESDKDSNEKEHKTSGSNNQSNQSMEKSSFSGSYESGSKDQMKSTSERSSSPATGSGIWRAPYDVDENAGMHLNTLINDILNRHPELAKNRLNEADQLKLQQIADSNKYSIKDLADRLKMAANQRSQQAQQQQSHHATALIHEAYASEIADSITDDPKSHQEAMNHPKAQKWLKADAQTKTSPRNQHKALIKQMGLKSSLITSMPRLSGSVKISNRTSTNSEERAMKSQKEKKVRENSPKLEGKNFREHVTH